MKICLAQIQSFKGDVFKNIELHKRFIQIAIDHKCNAIFFPELSLTGYEPQLAKKLAFSIDDDRLVTFQSLSTSNNISICFGFPLKHGEAVKIAMGIFQPSISAYVYTKNKLHADEIPYFKEGDTHLNIRIDKTIITPAICYESLLPEHTKNITTDQSSIYLATVAKHSAGIAVAKEHYSATAKKYKIHVLMVNTIGLADNFCAAGQSAVWSPSGELIDALDQKETGYLIFDSILGEVTTKKNVPFNRN